MATTTTIPCPKCERPTELGEARYGWHRCASCGTKFKLAEYVPTAVNPATVGGANACGGCGATLRKGARHCHQCGVKVPTGFLARLVLVPVLTALLGGACYALVLLLLAAPLQVQSAATVSASRPPEQRQPLTAERRQLKTSVAEAAQPAASEMPVIIARRDEATRTPTNLAYTADLNGIAQTEVIRKLDAAAAPAGVIASPATVPVTKSDANQSAEVKELRQQLFAAKAELARLGRQEDERLSRPASATRANWQTLMELRIQNPDLAPADVRKVLGSPDEGGTTVWTYRPYLAKGRIQWSGGRIYSITLPDDLPR